MMLLTQVLTFSTCDDIDECYKSLKIAPEDPSYPASDKLYRHLKEMQILQIQLSNHLGRSPKPTAVMRVNPGSIPLGYLSPQAQAAIEYPHDTDRQKEYISARHSDAAIMSTTSLERNRPILENARPQSVVAFCKIFDAYQTGGEKDGMLLCIIYLNWLEVNSCHNS